jgi:hypothetical protein
MGEVFVLASWISIAIDSKTKRKTHLQEWIFTHILRSLHVLTINRMWPRTFLSDG